MLYTDIYDNSLFIFLVVYIVSIKKNTLTIKPIEILLYLIQLLLSF